MTSDDQLNILNDIGDNTSFSEKVKESGKGPIRADGVEILQLNIGKKCNLCCKHCHVEAGPDKKEMMSKKILNKCLEIIKLCNISTVDITGGAPEMNPHLEWFIQEVGKLNKRIIIRSNLVILLEDEYKKFIQLYKDNGIEIVTSLPDYFESKTDRQRGKGVFQKIIEVIKQLNDLGYSKQDSGLILDLVHNPVGAYLPGSQKAIKYEYRQRLKGEFSVTFNNLFTITNIPAGRYLKYLIESGNYNDYMTELCNAYNPIAVDNVMCRTTVSVGWDGSLYDCDFNQMLDLKINDDISSNINNFSYEKLKHRDIVIHNHCYGCAAGSGSSCQGAIVEED